MESLIARVLLWGGVLSGLLILFGLVLHLGQGGFHDHALALQRPTRSGPAVRPPGVFISLREVFGALSAHPLDPLADIALGIVLLLITPVLGVAAAVPAFLREGDRRYAVIALIVLSMLLASLLLAGGAA